MKNLLAKIRTSDKSVIIKRKNNQIRWKRFWLYKNYITKFCSILFHKERVGAFDTFIYHYTCYYRSSTSQSSKYCFPRRYQFFYGKAVRMQHQIHWFGRSFRAFENNVNKLSCRKGTVFVRNILCCTLTMWDNWFYKLRKQWRRRS